MRSGVQDKAHRTPGSGEGNHGKIKYTGPQVPEKVITGRSSTDKKVPSPTGPPLDFSTGMAALKHQRRSRHDEGEAGMCGERGIFLHPSNTRHEAGAGRC